MILVDSKGNGLNGGIVTYQTNKWYNAGVTDESGKILLNIPENYSEIQVDIKYLNGKSSLKQKINANNIFEFRTIDTVVKLESSTGKNLSNAKATYYNNGWRDFGVTDLSGEIHKEILPGDYLFDMIYEGKKSSVQQDIKSNPIVIFKVDD